MRFADGAALAEHDALDPVIANDAAPKRIVEIEDEALLRQPALRGENSAEEVAVERCHFRRNFHLRLEPARWIEPRGDTVALAGAGDIEEQHALFGGGFGEPVVE